MSRDATPLDGDPPKNRYDGIDSQSRYEDGFDYHRSDCVHYQFKGATLEEEARFGGWLPNDRPTGPDPIDLFTIGMRGEPGYDDDPVPATDGVGYEHEGGQKPLTGIIDVD